MSTQRERQKYLYELENAYRLAYLGANGREVPYFHYEHGWFTVNQTRVRARTLEEMTKRLQKRVEAKK